MDDGYSLYEYIRSNYPHTNIDEFISNVPNSFLQFLSTTKILESQDIETTTLPTFEDLHYPEFVDSFILFLVRTKLTNVIVNGYINPSVNSTWSTNLINPYINFQVNYIKSENWNRVHNLIGRVNFLELLLSTKCYTKLSLGHYLQLFGIPSYFKNFDSELHYWISNYKLLNKNRKAEGISLVLTEISTQKLQRICHHSKFQKLVRILQKNDYGCKYSQIFRSIVTTKHRTSGNILDSTTSLKQVVKFVLVIIGKLIPLGTWGSNRNKNIFLKSVVYFIQAPSHSRFNLRNLLAKFDVNAIPWSNDVNTIFVFLEWIFDNIIFRVIKSFWYVTESTVSINSNLLFFPHTVWNSITKPWLRQYTRQYLIKTEPNRNLDNLMEKFNYGYLRLIPKASDFRFILVPAKVPFNSPPELNSSHFEFEFAKYSREYIDAVRQFITVRSNQIHYNYPRCSSSRDIAININNYKVKLIEKLGNKDFKVCMLKFDMKQCYDRLNQKKVFGCIESLFQDLPDDYTFSLRHYTESPIHDLKVRKNRIQIKYPNNVIDFNCFDLGNEVNETRVLVDKVKTIQLTKKQILEISEQQIFDTTILFHPLSQTLYKRKNGVFQGCPLLSTFCNITYDHMVEKEFEFLLNLDSLLLRVVDDFLILSTDIKVCEKARDLIYSTRLHQYGAFVNKSKTVLSNGENGELLKFLGLKVSTRSLEIYKDYSEASNIPLTSQESFEKVFQHLLVIYKSRLETFLISKKLCSQVCILKNVLANLISILDTFILNYSNIINRGSLLKVDELKLFLSKLIRITREKYISVNETDLEFDLIKHEMFSSMLAQFKKREVFREIALWIRSIMNAE